MKLKYIFHSSFLIETEKFNILFDYFKGDIPDIDINKKLYVLSSHSHRDHFNEKIFRILRNFSDVTYILSYDIEPLIENRTEDIHFVSYDEEKTIGDIAIRTLKSTDEGVAFILSFDDRTIYHAGDLNWWTWKGFETQEEYEAMTSAFKKEIEKIKGMKFDLAMMLLDPRQGERYDWGMKFFLENTECRYVAPMHCWKKYHVIDRFIRENSDLLKDTVVIKTDSITSEGYEID